MDKKTEAESSKCNVVAQETIWKESVHRETTAARTWWVDSYRMYTVEPLSRHQWGKIGSC